MTRYIDADALIKKVFPYDVVDTKCYSINAKMIYNAIQEAPTADVVPKSEVERLLDEIDGWFMYCENYSGHLIKIKLAELKKKYTEENDGNTDIS